MDDLVLETSLLKVPLEGLKTSLKQQQKLVERDAAWLLQQAEQQPCHLQSLDKMIARLEQLQGRLANHQVQDDARVQQSRARLAHLEQHKADAANKTTAQNQAAQSGARRLDRLVADYLLRRGFASAAQAYATAHDVKDLIDTDAFSRCAQIAAALQAGNAAPCLAWCADHKTSLRKRASPLEFRIRRQELVEQCRLGRYAKAIEHARRYLGPQRAVYGGEVDTVCALLCHGPETTLEPYKTLYAREQWQALAQLFTETHHALYNIPLAAPLETALSAGLAALKTPACAETCHHVRENAPDGMTLETLDAGQATQAIASKQAEVGRHFCPLCSPDLLALAADVPVAKLARSQLVDVLAPEGGVMEGENSPVAVPSGRVYGLQSLEAYSARQGVTTGQLMDPVTEAVFDASAVRKVFVL